MKKVVSIILIVSAILSFSACSLPKSVTNNNVQSGKTKTTTQKMVDEKLLTVDVRMPLSFFEEDKKDPTVLTDEQKNNGFLSAKKDEDYVIYTIRKSDWRKLLKELKSEIVDMFDDMVNGEDYTSYREIKYNDDFSKLTFKVDEEKYENSIDGFANLAVYLNVAYYQMFCQKEAGTVITIVDYTTGEKINEVKFPFEETEQKES